MFRKIVSAIMLFLLVISAWTLAFDIRTAFAQAETIYINADGSITPSTAPIYTADNITYTLTGNITANADGIVIERNNIILDGAGYTLQGPGIISEGIISEGIYSDETNNVTVRNTNFIDFDSCIEFGSSSYILISGNNVANSEWGIELVYSSDNSVSGNNITNNTYGITFFGSNNTNVSGNNITNNAEGIKLGFSSVDSFSGNNITDNGGPGVFFDIYSGDNSVSGNNITNNGDGIDVESSGNSVSGNNITANNNVGISLGYSSSDNSVSGNNITANNVDGIFLFSSSDNNVNGNTITNNSYGMAELLSENNCVSGNNITDNGVGIWLDSSFYDAIYHNNFINNTSQVYSYQSPTVWDNGYPSGGNYWSDYNGTDLYSGPHQNVLGSDGIGDTPYNIIDVNEVPANEADHYPLMKPYNTNSPSVSISPVSATLDVGGKSQPFISTVSGGASPYTYQWYVNYAPVSGATSNSWTFTPTSEGSYTVYLSVFDSLGVTAASNDATVNVIGPPFVSVMPASVVVDVGQHEAFSSAVSAGTSPYTYQWYLNGTAVLGATYSGWTFAPNSSGSYSVYLSVTDSSGVTVTSNTANVFTPTRYSITFGQTDVGSDYTGTVVTIDGTNYTASGLPVSFAWDEGSTHSFAYQEPLLVSGETPYYWANTSGLSTLQSGSITVTGPGSVTGNYGTDFHEVIVTNVAASTTAVYQGGALTINVTVKNVGAFNESAVSITLYYDVTASKSINTYPLYLGVGQSLTFTFIWNTKGVPYQNYTLTAVATIPTGSNTLSDGNITVRLMGDINGDGRVNLKDIALVARAFGSTPSSPNWNPAADINGDGIVNMKDITLVARHFGQHYP